MKKIFGFLFLLTVFYCSKDEFRSYFLSVIANTGGTVSILASEYDAEGKYVSVGKEYSGGKIVDIRATPDDEYRFVSWSNGETKNPLSVVVDKDIKINANFQKAKYNLIISTYGKGSVLEEVVSLGRNTDPRYNSGSVVRLTANAAYGYRFVRWDGDLTSNDNPVELNIDSAKSIIAVFELIMVDLEIITQGQGSVSQELMEVTSSNKNTTYKVEASHPNYPPIVATTYIPEDLIVDYEVELDNTGSPDEYIYNDNGTPDDDSDDFKEYNPNFNPNYGGLNGVELNFDDNPNQDNFYRLKIYSSCFKEWETEDGQIEIDYFRGYLQMMSNDPSFESSLESLIEGYAFIGNQVVFDDALFNGQEKNIRLDIDSYGWRYANCDTVRIQFSIFSADTYSYYNSLNNHRQIGIFGGEVIPVYSNVENGLGSFISINDQILQLKPLVD